MRWPLRRRGGRLPSLGQDYERAHRAYVKRLGPGGELWLRTKPFGAPPNYELGQCLHTFAHVVERLGLGLRAQVLDVGCGPGWLSEFLARCGYWVTGVDVSEDMVCIARERVAAIQGPVGEGVEPLAEFHALPVREMPWTGRFDAAILYDTMHHFDDELETLRVIRRTLVPGGRIYLHEGVRPEAGSEGERVLIAEMEEHGTLESPFDPDYLVSVVREAGFVEVTRLAPLDELVDLTDARGALRRVAAKLERPSWNTLVAVNPVPAEIANGADFRGRIETSGGWQRTPGGQELSLPVTVTNSGRGFWPSGTGFPLPRGVVTVGPYVRKPEGERVELPRANLPRSLSPGESIDLEVRIPLARVAGESEVEIDLVREGIAWFAEYGSPPLVVPLADER